MQNQRSFQLFISVLLAFSTFHAHAEETIISQLQPAESVALATTSNGEYTLAPGDQIRVLVFQNPDLTLDTRVSENGNITYPLIGTVKVGDMPIAQAEESIASALRAGGFVQQPQVNITLVEIRGNQVSVLGAVSRPGRFPLESFNTKLSDMLANAGGINPGVGPNIGGSDQVIVTGMRNGVAFHKEIDVADMFLSNKPHEDIEVASGDVIYVPAAPQYYIYGEAQRPGSFRIKRNMTIQQAVAEAGGPSLRGTERGMRLYRHNAEGVRETIRTQPTDLVQPNDVIFVTESLF